MVICERAKDCGGEKGCPHSEEHRKDPSCKWACNELDGELSECVEVIEET